MILFTILALILFALIAITVTVIAVGGAVGVIVFGDIIVCIFIIIWIMKKIINHKKK